MIVLARHTVGIILRIYCACCTAKETKFYQRMCTWMSRSIGTFARIVNRLLISKQVHIFEDIIKRNGTQVENCFTYEYRIAFSDHRDYVEFCV